MAETRTIDDLGIDSSIRWAKEQQLTDLPSIRQSSQISSQVQIDVLTPRQENTFLALFETLKREQSWANFDAPPEYGKGRNNLFTNELVPSLGTNEQGQTLIEKLRQMDEREFKDLIEGLEQFQNLNGELATINGRRSQFTKG